MTPDSMATLREISMTQADFTRIAALVRQRTGIFLPETKRALIFARLMRRLRACNVTGFADYIDLLTSGAGDAEIDALISAVTTNVTAFFREPHHFAQLSADILPDLIRRARAGGRVRLWSAGCSSGEEAVSLAGVVLRACPEAAGLNLRVLATDVDHAILLRARGGRYPSATRGGIPADMATVLFNDPDAAGGVAVRDQVCRLIRFMPQNLLGDWYMTGKFDVIFCRNVVIYFDRITQETLWQRFSDILLPGGHLMIGHSERLSGPALGRFAPAGTTTYRKTCSHREVAADHDSEADG